jgi:hypothetical protein
MLQEHIAGKKKPEYRGLIPRDGGLDDANRIEIQKTGQGLPWEFQYNGRTWRRVKVFDVYALLPRDIKGYASEIERAKSSGELPDPDKMLMPVVISFRSTSFKAGQEVATYMAKAQAMGTVPYGGVFSLGCEQDSNDQGTFYVFKCWKSGRAEKAWVQEASKWGDVLKSNRFKVDETELVTETGADAFANAPDLGQF